MIKLKKISMSNFMAFGKEPIEVELDQGKHILIQGRNEDVGGDGESRNGAAKTTIMNGVIFALYGKGIDKLKPDQFVNIINKKKMVVELDLEVNGEPIKIRRGRKPAFVELYKGDVSLTRDSMKNTEDDIQSLIGIPYEVFMSIYFLSPHKESFMSMTPAEQRNYLESILSLDVLVNRSETLKAIKKDLGMDIKLIEKDYQNALSNKEKAESNVERLRASVSRFEQDRTHTIASIEESLEEASQIDFDAYIDMLNALPSLDEINKEQMEIKGLEQKREMIEFRISNHDSKSIEVSRLIQRRDIYFKDLTDKKSQLEVELSTLPSKEYLEESDSLKKQLQAKREQHSVQKQKRDALKRANESLVAMMEKMLDELESLEAGSCPYCKQSHYDESKVRSIEKELAQKEKDLDEFETHISHINQELSSLEEDEHELAAKVDNDLDEHRILDQIRKIEIDIDHINGKLDEPNPYEEQIKSIETEMSSFDSKKMRNDIHEIDLEISRKRNRLNEIEALIEEVTEKVRAATGVISISDLTEMKKEVSQLEKDLQREKSKENIYKDELKRAEEEIPDVTSIENEMNELKKDEEHVSYLVKLLTDPKSFVRKNIVDQYIPFVNKKINEYAEQLGLMHVSEILPDMTVDIQYMRREVSYFNMSQGERLRLNLATAMAFGDLMRLLGKQVNVFMVDEYLDSALDSDGMFKAFRFLKSKASNVIMISHRDELCKEVDQTLVVTKKNGFSSITVQ